MGRIPAGTWGVSTSRKLGDIMVTELPPSHSPPGLWAQVTLEGPSPRAAFTIHALLRAAGFLGLLSQWAGREDSVTLHEAPQAG